MLACYQYTCKYFLVDSGKINRETNEPIRKPEVIVDYNLGVDLVSRVIIPYNSQRQGSNGIESWQNFLLSYLCTVVLSFSEN